MSIHERSVLDTLYISWPYASFLDTASKVILNGNHQRLAANPLVHLLPLRELCHTSRMKLYEGCRTPGGCQVTVDGRPLPLRHDLRNHSPTGAEWGYGGSGPAQLALALLADVLGDELALDHYQKFKRRVVACLSREKWQLTETDIRSRLEELLNLPPMAKEQIA